jgi:hypothetical protein
VSRRSLSPHPRTVKHRVYAHAASHHLPARLHATAGRRQKRALHGLTQQQGSHGHNLIGTEHILLGLIFETESPARAVLRDLDADPDEVRGEILNRLDEAGEDAP